MGESAAFYLLFSASICLHSLSAVCLLFQSKVVDMRWGVRDEMTNEHMTTDLCMTELRNCQRLSMGPNFIYFGAQKYGYRLFFV